MRTTKNAKRSWEDQTRHNKKFGISLFDGSKVFFMAFRVACQLTSRLTSISSVGLSFISCAKITGNFRGGLLSLKFLTLRHCFFSAKKIPVCTYLLHNYRFLYCKMMHGSSNSDEMSHYYGYLKYSLFVNLATARWRINAMDK